MKTAMFVFGTRPEAIKIAPLVRCLRDDGFFRTVLVCTGQHREMLTSVYEIFDFGPDVTNETGFSSIVDVVSNSISYISEQIDEFSPDFLIVHGDTATTLSASLVAHYRKIFLCHVEAGLRSFDLERPWPEEANRRITSVLADLNFCPTPSSAENLLSEGISSDKIVVTGNTVVDALKIALARIDNDPSLAERVVGLLSKLDGFDGIVTITSHRRENLGNGLTNICEAVRRLAFEFPNVAFIFPVHLNPLVRNIVESILNSVDNVYLIEPLDYLNFIYLLRSSQFIISDSGGIQEEAPSLDRVVLVTRDVTERPEALSSGHLVLVGTDPEYIYAQAKALISDNRGRIHIKPNPYGDGLASVRILNYLKEIFSDD